jgi:hypothetical protein
VIPDTTALFEATAGTVPLPLTANLYDGDGDEVPLAGSSVTFQMLAENSGTYTTLTGTTTITDDTGGGVSYAWGSNDLAIPGSYRGQFVVSNAGASQAYPADGILILVSAPLNLPGPSYGPHMMWCDANDVLNFDLSVGDTGKDLTPYIQAASEFLWAASGRQFPGVQQVTIRPTHQSPPRGASLDGGGSWWALSGAFWGGYGYPDGSGYFGAGGFAPVIRLGNNVRAISQVMIDGVVVDPSTYTFFRASGELIRASDPTTGSNPGWPYTDDPTLPLTAVGTFGITLTYGADPPMGGRLVAAQLAGYYAKGTVTNLVNAKGLYGGGAPTGILFVDAWLAVVNPKHLQRRARVLSIDLPPHRIQG